MPASFARARVTSEATAALCGRLGVPLTTLVETPELDVVIDGADEVDPDLNLIKGLGGAHLREKVVASAGRAMIVVADESKLVAHLGERAPLPVEVVEFALPVCERRCEVSAGSRRGGRWPEAARSSPTRATRSSTAAGRTGPIRSPWPRR